MSENVATPEAPAAPAAPVEQAPQKAQKVVSPDLNFVNDVIKSGGESLKKCYQCATCTVVCNVTPEDNPFPRWEFIGIPLIRKAGIITIFEKGCFFGVLFYYYEYYRHFGALLFYLSEVYPTRIQHSRQVLFSFRPSNS